MKRILWPVGSITLVGLALVGLLFQTSCISRKKPEPTLNLAIWSNYLAPDILEKFQKKTGIRVVVSHYASNEELLAKLQAGATGYDVAVPSDYMVFALRQLQLLEPVRRDLITHCGALDSRFLGKSFDPKNEHSLPYNYGTTGIAYRKDLFPEGIKGFQDLFSNPKLKGKFTLLDDARESLGAALKILGKSSNTKNPQDIAAAKKLLSTQRDRVKEFTSETKNALIEGQVWAAHVYSSDALQARESTGGKVQYVIPIEGATLWLDSFVIPKGAPHITEAHRFIDFMLETESAQATVKHFLATANRSAAEALPVLYKNDPLLFPDAQTMPRLEMLEDLGESLALYDRAWTEVKAGKAE
jgi:spermidine/putrescine transport system substrate-binding protein